MEDHSTNNFGQSISKLSVRTASALLLDLPQSILEEIVTSVRRTTQYDGYLCELRLVSRRLNEAVLHCLSFQDSPRHFFPRHYMSCPTEFQLCHKPSCISVGRCIHMYARYRLQARIQLSRAKDLRLAGYYETLARALDLFHEHLEHQDALFAVARSQVKNTNLFRCASLNPIFADRPSIIFCEATLTLLETVTRCWHDAAFADHDLSRRNAWFWLRNLACFLGDIELFDFYSSQAYSGETAFAGLLMELPELLATTAARSHQALFQHILCQMPPSQNTDLTLALREACCSGNLRITNMILQACPAGTVATMCAESLYGYYGSRRLLPNYSAVAEQVVNKCREIPTDKLCMILWTQAELGASSVVRLLLERYQNRTFWPHRRDMLVASFSALWSACVNSDIQCVRILMRDGFFANVEKADTCALCLECIDAAAQANAFAICQELCDFLSIETHSLSFNYLAGVDGSMEAMNQKLEISPDELNAITHESGTPTVGQVALKRAAELLRVENVRFLLERGIRLHGTCYFEPLRLDWRRKRANEQKYREVQELLQKYGLAQLQVEL